MGALFAWAENSWWGTFVRESTWGFAIIETVHLLGLVLLLGGIFVMSLRLMGLSMADRPVSKVASDLRPWTLLGLSVMLLSGLSLWASEALRMYDSPPFWLKMRLLVAALAFHFTIYRRVSRRDTVGRLWRGTVGAVAILLWFSVGFLGRVIGFF
jgi:hypothetical protein